MKKTIVGLTAILLAAGLCVFIGCQKNKNADAKQQETNVQLVPDSIALKVAQSFNSTDFFDEKNPTNHYPVKTRLTGNNKIAEQFKFNDSYGNPALFVLILRMTVSCLLLRTTSYSLCWRMCIQANLKKTRCLPDLFNGCKKQ